MCGKAEGSFSLREKVRMRVRKDGICFEFPHPSPLPAEEGILDKRERVEARNQEQHSRKFLNQPCVCIEEREDVLSLPRWNRKDCTFDAKLLVALQDRFLRCGPKDRHWDVARLTSGLESTLVEFSDRRREVVYFHSGRNPPITVLHYAMEALG
jgi:hypothetical protein